MGILVVTVFACLVLFIVLGFKEDTVRASYTDGNGIERTKTVKQRKWAPRQKQLLVLPLLIAGLAVSSITVVPTGYTGILTTFGKVEDRTIPAGAHLILPWQKVVKMDNRTQKVQITTEAFSSDIQQVNLDISINYCIDQTTAQELYRTVGINYYDNVMYPRILENTKAVFSKYTAENLVSAREQLSVQIKSNLSAEMEKYGITIVSMSIENIDFTDAFTDAVESKQVAAQRKLQAEIEQEQKTMETEQAAERQKIEAEAKAEVAKIEADANAYAVKVQAEAEAESNRKVAESLTTELIEYTEIRAWNGELPGVMVGEGSEVVPVLNIGSDGNE